MRLWKFGNEKGGKKRREEGSENLVEVPAKYGQAEIPSAIGRKQRIWDEARKGRQERQERQKLELTDLLAHQILAWKGHFLEKLKDPVSASSGLGE